MITRVLTQVKVFDISARSDCISCQGFYDKIDGITWIEGQIWESDAQCNELLENAIEDWKIRRNKNVWETTSHKPELIVYWKTISKETK